MVWEKPKYAILFIILLVMLYFLYKLFRWKNKALKSFVDNNLEDKIFELNPQKNFKIKYISLFLSVIFLILSIMGPKWGAEKQQIKSKGIDIVFALDLSNSMNALDISPNRLDKSKKFIKSYLDRLAGDRVGLVIFAGDAYSVSPLTTDYKALESFIEGFTTDLIWNQGTDFSIAIKKCVETFDNQSTNKAIVFISDGEDHEGNIEETIELVKEKNIKIFTIGVGEKGAYPIPVKDEYDQLIYKTDQDDRVILTSFDATQLEFIAKKTEGKYIPLKAINKTVIDLQSNINKLDKRVNDQTYTYEKKQQFQWFLSISILCLFIYTLTSDNRKQRL